MTEEQKTAYLTGQPFAGPSLGDDRKLLSDAPHWPVGITYEEMFEWGGVAARDRWDQEVMAQRRRDDILTFGQGIAAVPGGEHTMRPIGLALIDSDIRYRSDRPVVLRIEDGRGNAMAAELVERNLWPATPFARAYAGFREPVRREAVAPEEVRELAARLVDDSAHNDAWRRSECVNLIPSEQCVSPFVEKLCVADPAGRYNEHSRLRSLGPDAPYVRYYKGTEFSMEHEIELKAALRTFFGCARVETRVVSGQMANDTVYDALKQFRNRHRRGKPPLFRIGVTSGDLGCG